MHGTASGWPWALKWNSRRGDGEVSLIQSPSHLPAVEVIKRGYIGYYRYSAEGSTYEVPLTIYEGHLEYHIPYSHIGEISVFVDIEYGVPRSVETSILLDYT